VPAVSDFIPAAFMTGNRTVFGHDDDRPRPVLIDAPVKEHTAPFRQVAGKGFFALGGTFELALADKNTLHPGSWHVVYKALAVEQP
jgi:hypothetical protein